jgi:hypothetical protein
MKTISAHSPRSFLSEIFGFRFFIDQPQNEKGSIRRKFANAALCFYSTGIKSPRQGSSQKRAGTTPKNGNAIVDTLYDVISYEMS